MGDTLESDKWIRETRRQIDRHVVLIILGGVPPTLLTYKTINISWDTDRVSFENIHKRYSLIIYFHTKENILQDLVRFE